MKFLESLIRNRSGRQIGWLILCLNSLRSLPILNLACLTHRLIIQMQVLKRRVVADRVPLKKWWNILRMYMSLRMNLNTRICYLTSRKISIQRVWVVNNCQGGEFRSPKLRESSQHCLIVSHSVRTKSSIKKCLRPKMFLSMIQLRMMRIKVTSKMRVKN